MRRRGFLASPLALAATPTDAAPRIYAYGDGIPHTPAESAALLAQLAPSIQLDEYSRQGIVAELESRFAQLLHKEAAVFLPTGTLANHLALRLLAAQNGGRRVLVPEQSHLFRDSGDCAQTLSSLNLIPLAPHRPSYTLEEAQAAFHDSQSAGRVPTPVAALLVESPVRRQSGAVFPFSEMQRLSAWAASQRIGRHLDGARLFLETPYTGHSLRDYTSLFDTVYVSLYKYFNAPAGAILAGPRALLADVPHLRRMFGASLYHAWPSAALALHYANGFSERFARAAATGRQVLDALERESHFTIDRVPSGTNIFRLKPLGANPSAFHGRLEQAGISARLPAAGDTFTIQVNETWLRASPEEITARFRRGIS